MNTILQLHTLLHGMYKRFTGAAGNIHYILSVLVIMASSCNIINPAEPVPAYVHADSISLKTDLVTEGSSSCKINDVWAYVDGNVIGTFEMPVTFPVLAAGVHRLTIRPGILMNGIAATRAIYPFYSGFDTTVNFESAQTFQVNASTHYISGIQFSLLEDFDHTGISFIKDPASDTSLMVVTDQFSMENNYGAVYLDDSHPNFKCTCIDSFPIAPGIPAYLEFNYQGDNEFTVGITSYTTLHTYNDDIVTFRPTSSWKKEYVNLYPFVNAAANASGFKIYFRASKASALASAAIRFDNIKVVH